MTKTRSLPFLLASLFVLTGCASGSFRPSAPDAFHTGEAIYQPQEFVVEKPMPDEPPFGTYFEDAAPAPVELSDPYWIPGYWGWKSPDWVWIRGRWVERPRPGLLWINARSHTIGPRIFWQTGYWQ